MSDAPGEPGERPLPTPAGVPSPPTACAYCRWPIDPRWYFCLRCATPWADPDRIVRPVRPLRLTPGQLVREKVPVVWSLFWTYFAVVLGGSIVAELAAGEDRPVLRVTLVDAALLVTTCWFAVIHARSLVPQLARSGFLRWEAWAALAALVPLLAVGWAYHSALEAAGFEVDDLFQTLRDGGLSETGIVVLGCVLPAVTEEIAFRGLLQHWLHAALSARTAIVLASALFAALHLSIASAPYLFLAGVLLGWAKHRTGSLYPSIAIHFLHNLAVVEILHR